MTDSTTWQDRVRSLLRERGATQEDIAPLFGVAGQGGVTHYMTGRRKLRADQAVRIAEFFGISVDYLLAGHRLDPAATVAREKIADIVRARLDDLGVDAETLCRQFPGLDVRYLDRICNREYDLSYTDLRTLGPLLGPETAAAIVEVLAERDGRGSELLPAS